MGCTNIYPQPKGTWIRTYDALFDDPVALRSHIAESGAPISGSLPLQYFERSIWPSSDLDIYVRDGDGSDSLYVYLEEEEGYYYQTTDPVEPDYDMRGIEVDVTNV